MVDEDILASLRELEEALSDSAPLDGAEGRVQRCSYYPECLFYLLTYGTHLNLISFYLRHDCLRDALTHIQNKVLQSYRALYTSQLYYLNYTTVWTKEIYTFVVFFTIKSDIDIL